MANSESVALPTKREVHIKDFTVFVCGSPNWESKVKTTNCCFYRSDVSRCEQNEHGFPCDVMRHISRRAQSGTSDCLRSKLHLVRASSGEKRKAVLFRTALWLSAWCELVTHAYHRRWYWALNRGNT